jgi:ketosteroid isomerase-like protein
MDVGQAQRLEYLRGQYAAYNRGDFDQVVEMADPEIVLVRTGGQGEVRGPSELRAWMEPDAFEAQTLDPQEFYVVADKVLVRLRGVLRGAGSGLEMEIGSWTVWTFDDQDRVTRIEVFLEHEEDEARRALRD